MTQHRAIKVTAGSKIALTAVSKSGRYTIGTARQSELARRIDLAIKAGERRGAKAALRQERARCAALVITERAKAFHNLGPLSPTVLRLTGLLSAITSP